MKITYLGTSAAEGMPAVFCNCEYCREARRLGGRNIRTRSQTFINDDLLIDLPADTYMHFLQNGIEADRIEHLLLTHSHPDHLYPTELENRHGFYAHDMRVPELKVYCGKGAYEKIAYLNDEDKHVRIEQIAPFDTVQVGRYAVTALPARHFVGDGALNYIIEDDRTLLYAHDTGYFLPETFAFLQKKGFRFDLVSLDCTNVDIPISDEGSHMGLDQIQRVLERLSAMGAVDEKTIRVINHFSHNANPLYHVLEKRVEGLGYRVSYDGMTVEF